jgi:hypothetical protein
VRYRIGSFPAADAPQLGVALPCFEPLSGQTKPLDGLGHEGTGNRQPIF